MINNGNEIGETKVSSKKMGIYIHWPFCTHICPYCDFNIYRARGQDNDGLFTAIKAELDSWYQKTSGRKLDSIYFGGGTPSLMEMRYIEQIIDFCAQNWGLRDEIEISLEANPNDGEIAKFRDFRSAGINRLSLGVQSFYDSGLKELGRFHSKDDAISAAKIAREIFPQLSLDLIYARQNQTIEEWIEELEIANQIQPDHISPYGLTIEPNTSFAKKHARGTLKIPNDDLAARFYETTDDKLTEFGFIGYEISNHARSKDNFSRHNLLYWQSQDWIGIGPGAHGRLTNLGQRHAISNILRPDEYIKSIGETGFALLSDEILSEAEIREEYYIMGLRLLEGIEISPNFAPLNPKHIKEFQNMDYIKIEESALKLTAKGRVISNYIISKLLD